MELTTAELRKWVQKPAFYGGIGAILVASASILWLVNGSLVGLPSWLGAAGGILLIGYAVLDREGLDDPTVARSAQFTARAWLAVVLAAGIAVAGYALAKTYDQTWDWTAQRAYTLSDQASRLAEAIDQDVVVTAFFHASAPGRRPFADLIRLFTQASPRISVEYVDPLAAPSRAAAAGITGDHGTVLLELGGRTERLEWEIDEEDLVRALQILLSAETHRVCWSTGHGEPDPDDEFSDRGLGVLRLELERLNHRVTKQRIAQQGIDQDCDLLLLARPQVDFAPAEREALASYVAQGGRAWLLLESVQCARTGS